MSWVIIGTVRADGRSIPNINDKKVLPKPTENRKLEACITGPNRTEHEKTLLHVTERSTKPEEQRKI
jgi:hypothetical protein